MRNNREYGRGNGLVGPLIQDLENPHWREITEKDGLADRFSRNLGLELNQLRKFFDQVKNIEEKLDSGKSWAEVEGDIWTIIPTLKYAEARGLCKPVFVEFVERGIAKVSEAEDREKAFKNFSKIFEAVVAYYKYNKDKKGGR